jgi:hypothetical protein
MFINKKRNWPVLTAHLLKIGDAAIKDPIDVSLAQMIEGVGEMDLQEYGSPLLAGEDTVHASLNSQQD